MVLSPPTNFVVPAVGDVSVKSAAESVALSIWKTSLAGSNVMLALFASAVNFLIAIPSPLRSVPAGLFESMLAAGCYHDNKAMSPEDRARLKEAYAAIERDRARADAIA